MIRPDFPELHVMRLWQQTPDRGHSQAQPAAEFTRTGRQVRPEISASKFAHIRTLVKYGMTVSQVAEVYGVAVGVIERVLGQA